MILNINQLKSGINHFEFEEDEPQIDHQSVSFEQIKIKSTIDKRSRSIVVYSRWEGDTEQFCDRCLATFQGHLEDKWTIFYTWDHDSAQNDDEEIIQVLRADQKEIDLSNGLRESVLLAIPMKKLCSKECKGLCSQCGTNLNHDDCDCVDETIDPRWEELRKLLNDDAFAQS